MRTRQREHRAVRALLPSSLFSRVLCGALLLPRAADRPRPSLFACGLGRRPARYLAHGEAIRHAKRLEPRALDDLKRYDPEMAQGLEWVLRHPGAEDLGLDFDELPGLDPAPVTDASKADFVRRKVRHVLLECRRDGLEAVRSGFWQAMVDLSPEATPFLRLLSATDWSLLLCGEDGLTAEAVADTLRFNGYPKQSRIPAWLPLAVEQFSPENLRRFLIFCTGAPSLPPAGLLAGFEIGVQYQRCSEALPVAHTCFNKLDPPDFQDQALFVEKFMKAIQECGTFDRV